MSDEKKITSLAEERSKRERKKLEQDYAQGRAFRLRELRDGSMNIGIADTDAIVLIAEGDLDGFVMSREYARKLGRELLEAADAKIPQEEMTT